MGGGFACVDRPTGDPNIESGAGLFAQLVNSGGSSEGTGRDLEGAGRQVQLRWVHWQVSKVRQAMQGRWYFALSASSWATCLRKEVLVLLAL